jgi:hypothetical protein
MSVSAAVIVRDKNVYRSIYIHSEGYLEHTGRILKEYYSDSKLALMLVAKGDLVRLTDKGKAEPLLNPGVPKATPSVKGACACYFDFEYIYLWEDGHWSLVDKRSGWRLNYYDHKSVTHAHCDICGLTKFIEEEEYFSGWSPEVFLHDHSIGRACPDCLDKYCRFEECTSEWVLSLRNVMRDNVTELRIFLDQILKSAETQIKN